MNSRQNKEFRVIFCLFKGVSGKILHFGGVISLQDLGRIRISCKNIHPWEGLEVNVTR